LLVGSGLLRGWDWTAISLVVGSSLLSFAAAESMATYIFGSYMTEIVGVDHKINAPPIILHVLVLALLWWKARAGVEERPSAI
jgi:hypothetical protein